VQTKQKAVAILVSSTVLFAAAILVVSNSTDDQGSNYNQTASEESIENLEEIPRSADKASEAPTSVIETGSIETKDGKNLSIWLGGEATNNFGELPFNKGESFTLTVTSEEERSLEIGLISISTEQVYSELVKTGKGTVVISIPEDGKYRVYVRNKSLDAADFDLKLSKAIKGPIV